MSDLAAQSDTSSNAVPVEPPEGSTASVPGAPAPSTTAPSTTPEVPFLLRSWWASAALFVAGCVFFLVLGQFIPQLALLIWLAREQGVGFFKGLDEEKLTVLLAPHVAKMVVFTPISALTLVGGLKLVRQFPLDTPTISTKRTLALTVGTCLVGTLGAQAIALWQSWIGFTAEEQRLMVLAFQGGITWDLFLAVVVFAPVGEEAFFRWFCYGTLRPCYGRVFAAFVSTALFALIHGNPPALLIYAWLGLCCAWIYDETGRISAAIAVHAFNNALALATGT